MTPDYESFRSPRAFRNVGPTCFFRSEFGLGVNAVTLGVSGLISVTSTAAFSSRTPFSPQSALEHIWRGYRLSGHYYFDGTR
jgi:hypothetical protein